jgi:hypothetical protein
MVHPWIAYEAFPGTWIQARIANFRKLTQATQPVLANRPTHAQIVARLLRPIYGIRVERLFRSEQGARPVHLLLLRQTSGRISHRGNRRGVPRGSVVAMAQIVVEQTFAHQRLDMVDPLVAALELLE